MKTLFKKYETPIKGGRLLQPLINIRGQKCECCGNTTWLNQPINLQVHHIDGDKTNNCLDNLQLLCLNCHSYTDNFGSKNRSKIIHTDEEIIKALKNHKSIRAALFSLKMSDASANYVRIRNLLDKNPEIEIGQNLPIIEQKITKEKHCPNCGKLILYTSNLCVECSQIAQRVVDRPNREELKNLIRSTSFLQIGKQFNVSDTTIRKWCDSYNLPRKKSIIKSYTDEEWKKI